MTTDFGEEDRGNDIAVQPDGKIVAAGTTGDLNFGGDFALARYNSNGSLDTSFGGGDGKVNTNFDSDFDQANALALQPDGKIVVVGTDGGFNRDFAVARYNTNGSLDTTFGGGDGKVTTDFDFDPDNDDAQAVVIQPDGKITVAGTSEREIGGGFVNLDFALARYLPNGTLDPTFGGGDGKVTTEFSSGTSNESASDLIIQPDGRLIAAGSAGIRGANNEFSNDFALARYLPDGTLDVTFDGDGKVTTDFDSNSDGVAALALQTDGKIIATGSTGPANSSESDIALARYNTNGSLDSSFGGDGKVTTEFSTECSFASDIAVQPNGKLIVSGGSCGLEPPGGPAAPDFGLARYNANGSLDNTFGEGGKARIAVGASALALQTDGKIVTVGTARSTGGDFDLNFALARYLITDDDNVPPPGPPSGECTVKGSSNNDNLRGTNGPDRICGGSGHDTISGLGGNDVILGASGDDRIDGGSGRDEIKAGTGTDTVNVVDGEKDSVRCGTGRDTVTADPQDDVAGDCERVTRQR